MPTETLSLNSADGTKLNMLRWGSSGSDVLVVHGQGEHAARYEQLGQTLANWGYRVSAVELRGHGHSGGLRNHVRRWTDYDEDVHAAAKLLKEPYIIIGHSMGGLVVLHYLRQHLSPEPLGVVLSNPLVALAFEPPVIKVTAAKLLASALPSLALATELDTNLLSRDKDVVRRYNEDPLINRKVTVRWFNEMVAAQGVVRNGADYPFPLLMMVGTKDGITDPAASIRLYESWRGSKTLKTYEGWYHELFNEPERQQAYEDVRAWMDALFASVVTR